MKKIKLRLRNLEGAEMFTRDQLKKIVGGFMDSGSEICMGCTTDQECAAVGKGKCQNYPDCNGGVHCCTGWTSC